MSAGVSAPGTEQQPTVVRRLDALSFMDGPEHCREYLRNEHLWFGTSVVPVGATGAVDPGHDGSWEVFYCAAGHAVVTCGGAAFELEPGDALRIPPAVPHQISNVGEVPVVIVWAGGPGEGAGA
ncbi:cupin domain-containing protein [Actinomadura logoneensis]|uniref:Cupin domain-containing protein n=1 Tax=Actinomadura logoneensis TaxID=2293572 RepID=A0A372JIH2_9ACTN|nr:cupin domain-containing protein [Actinomadura logoneensis]RFU39815.1 cupin domain-containing protein [Actinomadura logoneensis]